MQQFLSILAFYRSFLIWSFIINFGIAIVFPLIISAILIKLLLTIFVCYIVNETNAKQKLMFCKNLGVSTLKLFSSVYF